MHDWHPFCNWYYHIYKYDKSHNNSRIHALYYGYDGFIFKSEGNLKVGVVYYIILVC